MCPGPGPGLGSTKSARTGPGPDLGQSNHRCLFFSEELVNEETSQEPLSYTISIYTVSQMKKDPKKCGNSKNTVLHLEPEAIWDTFLAQLLVKIERMLKPKVLDFKDYAVTFSMPEVMDLTDEDMYKFMVERALWSKDCTVSIMVEPIVDTKVLYHHSLNMYI